MTHLNAREMIYPVRFVRTIRELFEGTVEKKPDNTAFLIKENNSVREITYAQAFADIKALATALNHMGLQGKRIAVIGRNCYWWAIAYLAVTCGCGVIVPIDRELKSPDISNILTLSESSAILYMSEMDAAIQATQIPQNCAKIPESELVTLIEKGNAFLAEGDTSYAKHRINCDELGALLFTSGTTGLAKGVMLTQFNICYDLAAVCMKVRITEKDRTLSILPLHHTYECMTFLAILFMVGSIAFVESIRKIAADMAVYKPTILVAVPLVLENIHANIIKKFKSVKGGAFVLGAGKNLVSIGNAVKINFSRSVFKKVHDAFGGRLRLIICGAASLSPALYDDFKLFGFKVLVGYGLTETSPVCIMHNDFLYGPDHVGKPVVGVSVKLDNPNEEGIGEIVVKGPNVMLGYYNNPEATAQVLQDGWFYTGDLGKVDKNGNYQIVGRIKSMIVTKNGKKIFPEELEYYLSQYPIVKECMAYGFTPEDDTDSEVVVAVKIFPDYEVVNTLLDEKGMTLDSPEAAAELDRMLREIVREINRRFPAYKMIRRITVRKTEFEKTTTRKIKRMAPENLKDE